MVQDPGEIKERIISTLKSRGPSLPVHIAGEIKSSILFSSAFLGELVSEKRVKMSHMKVGSSRLYLLAGQEPYLEKFSQHLKSKEKEAFLLLKEKKFLRDSAQNPAICVALRELRDFAIPFKSGGEVIWRYFLVPESEFKIAEEKGKIEGKTVEKQKPIEPAKTVKPIKIEVEKPLGIFSETEKQKKEEQEQEKPKPVKPKGKRRKISRKRSSGKEEKFFSDIKEFLSANSIDMLDIKNFGKKEIILMVKDGGKEKLLIAYNKNKITEKDIIKASKRASKENLPYMILGLGGPLKKIDNLIEALKGLSSIKKVK